MNQLRYFKKKSHDGGLPNPIGLLSTHILSQVIVSYVQTAKFRLNPVQLSSTGVHIRNR